MARVLRLTFPVKYKPVVIDTLQANEAVGQIFMFDGQMLDFGPSREPPAQDICKVEYSVQSRAVQRAIKEL
eukprot:SAG22_NODE_52_length_24288_cov_15.594568_1_plen_71_part_00